MKASFWAIVAVAAAGAGGSGYMLVPDRNGASASSSARDVVAVQQPASYHGALATTDLARAPITGSMHANPVHHKTACARASQR